MAIKTTPFSGWQLSGNDADAFLKQVAHPASNPSAKKAVSHGAMLAEEYQKKGYVIFSSAKTSSRKG